MAAFALTPPGVGVFLIGAQVILLAAPLCAAKAINALRLQGAQGLGTAGVWLSAVFRSRSRFMAAARACAHSRAQCLTQRASPTLAVAHRALACIAALVARDESLGRNSASHSAEHSRAHGKGEALRVRSSAFENGGTIPEIHTDYGKGVSPPLSWSAPPANTRSVVLMMEDPDATSPLPFVHWTFVVPPAVTQIPQGVPPIENSPLAPSASQGSNSRSTIGYFGPRPPAGEPPHHYHFQMFALDTELSLPSGYNRHALIQAM